MSFLMFSYSTIRKPTNMNHNISLFCHLFSKEVSNGTYVYDKQFAYTTENSFSGYYFYSVMMCCLEALNSACCRIPTL